MSFDRERSIIAQNAGTTAANLFATLDGTAEFDSVESALDVFDTIRRRVFDGTLALADATATPVSVADVVRQFPGAEVDQSGGATLTEATRSNKGDVKFTSGKYTGKTIAEVDAITDNRDGGRGYLVYYAENGKQENIVRSVKAYLASVGAAA